MCQPRFLYSLEKLNNSNEKFYVILDVKQLIPYIVYACLEVPQTCTYTKNIFQEQ
jgi:hypothetical protein